MINAYILPKNLGLTLLFVAASLMPKMTYAQECSPQPQATLAMTYNGFIPTVMAKINNQSVEMGIDTGAQRSVIAPHLVQKLGLTYDPSRQTQIYGTAGHQAVSHALISNLEFAGSAYEHLSLPIVSLTLPDIGNSSSPDNKLDGLIGVDILSHFDLDFDFPHGTLSLYRVTDCGHVTPPWTTPYMTVPLSITPSHRVTVPILLDGHEVEAVFDTGANGDSLSPDSASRAGLTNEIVGKDPLHDGAGVGGQPYKAPMHTFQTVKIGTQIYKNRDLNIIPLGSTEADMLLGEDYMRTRRFWLSYATKTLYIQYYLTP